MTGFVPMDHAELSGIRRQKALGWPLTRIAAYWGRTTQEVDLTLWWTTGSDRKHNITQTRGMINKRLAKMAAGEPLRIAA